MITSNDFKTGMTILYDNKIYKVLEFMHVKPGKGAAFVTSKLRNLRTGAVLDKTFRAGESMNEAIIEKKEMQYSYDTGESLAFLDTETWEQVEIPYSQVEYEKKFLIENMVVTVMFYGDEVLGLILDDKVVLTVVDCVPGIKGDTKTSATKDATMETGLVIKVPMFIEIGEKLIVSTETSSYVSREKK